MSIFQGPRCLFKSYLVFSEHKICLVGLDNAGKTTILYQFLMNEVVHTSPTIGSNVEEVVWNNIHFIMWDLGGQESLRTAWNTYYSNTEFILLVVDSTDRERLTITKEELHKMLQSDELCKASVLVFANKQVLSRSLLFSCEGAALEVLMSVSVCLSVLKLKF